MRFIFFIAGFYHCWKRICFGVIFCFLSFLRYRPSKVPKCRKYALFEAHLVEFQKCQNMSSYVGFLADSDDGFQIFLSFCFFEKILFFELQKIIWAKGRPKIPSSTAILIANGPTHRIIAPPFNIRVELGIFERPLAQMIFWSSKNKIFSRTQKDGKIWKPSSESARNFR